MTYKEIIKALEDLGEVFVKVTAHKIDKLDDGNLAFNADKKVVFALDPVKTSTKRKKARIFCSCSICLHYFNSSLCYHLYRLKYYHVTRVCFPRLHQMLSPMAPSSKV